MAKKPTIERIREVLDYDPVRGILSRKGEGEQIAKASASGHLYVRVDGVKMTAQQVAWVHVHGVWPVGRIGLVNKDKSDIRLSNLKDVVKSSQDVELTMDRLRSVLDYNPQTGVFTWKKVSAGTRVENGVAGSPAIGGKYVSITIDQKPYLAHRLAWFYVNGVWPEGEIDHMDGCGTNNRIDNLRDVSHAVNMQNIRAKTAKNKRSSLMGVSVSDEGRITSSLTFAGKSYYLGTFDTEHDAHKAYISAKRAMHEGCTI